MDYEMRVFPIPLTYYPRKTPRSPTIVKQKHHDRLYLACLASIILRTALYIVILATCTSLSCPNHVSLFPHTAIWWKVLGIFENGESGTRG